MIARICIAVVVAAAALTGTRVAGQVAAPAAPPAAPPAAAPAPSAAPAPLANQDELLSFITSAAATKPDVMHVTTMSAPESRDLPLVVVGTGLADASAKAVRATPKTRVWVQAASREGTDAAIMLLRDLAAGRNELWLTSIVLMISPVDVSAEPSIANDQIALTSPDTIALTQALIEYDPHVTVSVRTEDGPCSAYAVTFAPPLHPITSEHIMGLLRDEWVPFIVKNLKSKWSMNAFYQGVVEGGDNGCAPESAAAAAAPTAAAAGRRGGSPAAGRGGRAAGGGRGAAPARGPAAEPPPVDIAWRAPNERLSVTTNYLGARNRFALTGVVHAQDAAADRSQAASRFLEEALAFSWAASARLKKACEDADRQLLVGRSLPTSARPSTIGEVDVLMSAPPPEGSAAPAKRTAASRTVVMRDRLRYEVATDEVLAAEYLLPVTETATIDLLKQHGIQVRELTQPTKGLEEFAIAAGADLSSGSWKPTTAEVPAGTWVIRMNQPLARLAFALLEPTSTESVVRFLRDPTKAYTIMRRR